MADKLKKSTGKIFSSLPKSGICSCGKSIVPAHGPIDSPILLCGEFPGLEEVKQGRPFVGPSGRILRSELMRVGINLSDCRVTNIALHMFPEDGCYTYGMEQVINEARGRRAILLLGSECSRIFLEKSVLQVSGLVVKSKYLDAPVIVVAPNPAIVISGTLGEFRLAVERFAAAYHKKVRK